MLLALATALAASPAMALTAPNVVPIDSDLLTAGQPTRESLADLKNEGVQAVIYLAPSSVNDAIKEEPEILRRQEIQFIHIPIPFDGPTATHVEAVAAALDKLKGRKTLVHCQVNMRASTMVFLYRVLHRHEDPAKAYEAVTRVWVPAGPWKLLVKEQLSSHSVKFQPY